MILPPYSIKSTPCSYTWCNNNILTTYSQSCYKNNYYTESTNISTIDDECTSWISNKEYNWTKRSYSEMQTERELIIMDILE